MNVTPTSTQIATVGFVKSNITPIIESYTNYHNINPIAVGQTEGIASTKDTTVSLVNSNSYSIIVSYF